MKIFNLLFITLLFFGCKNQNETKEPATTISAAETVKEWLTWDGKSEMPHVVLISGDEEYRSEEAIPQLAKILSERHGFKCTVLFAQDPKNPGIVDPNFVGNIPGLQALESADMMVLFTRFRALPDEQMAYIDAYLKSGKPVMGMRTSTHAFHFAKAEFDSKYKHYGNYNESEDEWKDGFGRLVMGEHWISHHGKHGEQSTKGILAPEADKHPVLNGIEDGDIWGPTDVYGLRLPLPGDAKPLVLGQVTIRDGERDDSDPRLGMRPSDSKLPDLVKKEKDGKAITYNQNDPMMPVVWTKTYQLPGAKAGKCLATTMGAATDLLSEGTRRMLVNGVFWGLDLKVPEKANVDLVGKYNPSRFAFHDDAHWDKKNIVIAALK